MTAGTTGIIVEASSPTRISFFGGGTDLPCYYRTGYGATFSMAIEPRLFVSLTYGQAYSEGQIGGSDILETGKRKEFISARSVPVQIPSSDSLARACLDSAGHNDGIEISITTASEIPPGSGLGSSSAYATGMIAASWNIMDRRYSPTELAAAAVAAETKVNPFVGKQDAYAIALGGVHFIRYNSDESVLAEPVHCSRHYIEDLTNHLLLFDTGLQRRTQPLLSAQQSRAVLNYPILTRMRAQAEQFRDHVERHGELKAFGEELDLAWNYKKQLHSKISRSDIEESYTMAKKAGAWGGKIVGAGGGGHLLLMAPLHRHETIKFALSHYSLRACAVSVEGTKVQAVNTAATRQTNAHNQVKAPGW